MSTYTDLGYKNRKDYLSSLSDDYNIPIDEVECLADILGEEEDFDLLVTTLESFS